MVSIATKFNNAAAAANAQLHAAANAAGNGIKKAGNILVSPIIQREVFADVRKGVDSLYKKISTGANNANKTMETKGETVLHSSIKAMKEYKATPIVIKETDSTNKKGAKKLVNSLKNFHERVIVQGENISQKAGKGAHSLTSLILYPIRFVAKLLQVEVAGALIQNSIALAVGFAVRGIVLALSQLAHIAPYAATAAVIGGVGAALTALAVKVSPLAAIAVGIGFVLIGQQAQIAVLSNDVNKLANVIRADRQKTSDSTLSAKIKKLASNLAKGITVPASFAAKNKGKAATAALISAALLYGYAYGVPPVISETAGNISSYLASFFKPAIESTITASHIAENFQTATGKVVTEEGKNQLNNLLVKGTNKIASMEAASILKNGSLKTALAIFPKAPDYTYIASKLNAFKSALTA
ncbi:MAG: hypothetical protein K1000chlam3_01217 [Chlamydiae bacterium]|nr:hypothetical protein [Chlamydiota bacterium]